MQGTTQRKIVIDDCKNRTDGIFQYVNQSPISYLQKILNQNPYLKLKPNSLLAIAVIYEYENPRGSTIRKQWPEDLCGYIESTRRDAERLSKIRGNAILDVNNLPDTEYDQDECINQSSESSNFSNIFNLEISTGSNLPGTFSYATCIEDDASNPFESLYNVDWTTYFKSPVFPDLQDFDEETQQKIKEDYTEGLEQQLEMALMEANYPNGSPNFGSKKWSEESPGPGWEKTGKEYTPKGAFSVVYEWEYRGLVFGEGGTVVSGSLKPVFDSSAKQVMNLTASVSVNSGRVSFTWDRIPWSGWFLTNFYIRINGEWRGGKFEWIREGGQSVKFLENIYHGYEGHVAPPIGTPVAFTWTNVSGTERSNLATTTWA